MAVDAPPPNTIPEELAATDRPLFSLASLALLIISVFFAVAGQLTLKAAMRDIGRIGAKEVSDFTQTVARAAKEPKLWVGLVLFGISALFWLVVLSRVPLSVAYPFVGVSYIVIVGFSSVFLHEDVPALRWVGVVVVAIGIAIVGLSFRRATGV